ncbi:hypothetical protein [Spongiimicrobium sp. 3-5]|uniref:hypothetical protein n=1 Tax=Spongiimicrobium sp. 3-5 TaxID=3332596 RepID=UPI00397E964D
MKLIKRSIIKEYSKHMWAMVLWLALMMCSLQMYSQIHMSDEHVGYWEYKNKPVLLIGGWNHGHNPFLDHDTQDGGGYEDTSTTLEIVNALDELVKAGGNLIRCVLDPGVGAGRQGFDFCKKIDGKYNLSNMEGPYWERLDFFLKECQKRNIIVGIEVWDRFDWYDGGHKGWQVSPFNPINNVNYTTRNTGLAHSYPGKGDNSENPFGKTTPRQSYYLQANTEKRIQLDEIRNYQEKFVDRLLDVTLQYDNLIYSANNEVRHQESAWGEYWINYMKKIAAKKKLKIYCTDMFWDLVHLPDSSSYDYLLKNVQIYDYFDISQISAQFIPNNTSERERGEKHWQMVRYATTKALEVNRLTHMNKIYGSVSKTASVMGSDNNAIEEFWRGLIAGVAGARFHRPESGLGLSPKSKKSLQSVRLVEEKLKFWEVVSKQHLISEVEPDEAYVAAKLGEKYLIFFTNGGAVKLDLSRYKSTDFSFYWINIDKAIIQHEGSLKGGDHRYISAPSNGHWAAIVVRLP